MGSDLFESYVGSVIAAIALGASLAIGTNGEGVIVPLLLAAWGILSSIVGTFFVRTGEGKNPQKALDTGTYVATLLSIVGTFVICKFVLPETFLDGRYTSMGVFIASVAGLVAGTLIGKITEYYTSAEYKPVKEIASSDRKSVV